MKKSEVFARHAAAPGDRRFRWVLVLLLACFRLAVFSQSNTVSQAAVKAAQDKMASSSSAHSPGSETAGQPTQHPKAQHQKKQQPAGTSKKPASPVVPPVSGSVPAPVPAPASPAVIAPASGQVTIPAPVPSVSPAACTFFDKKPDGFYLKPAYVLFYLKSTGTVYVTSLSNLLKRFPQFGGSNSSNSLLGHLNAADLEKSIGALKKEPNTATVHSDCWKGDPYSTLFHGHTMLSKCWVCASGCGLTVTPTH